MSRTIFVAVVVALLAPLAGAEAQSPSEAWWAPVADRLQAQDPGVEAICRMRPSMPVCQESRDDARRSDDRDRGPVARERTGRRSDGQGRARQAGPPFCRNGQGHPVHGMAWCREKGFAGGAVWRDVSWGDIILGPRDPRQRNATYDRGGLLDVLGDVVLRRLEAQPAARSGGALSGRLLDDGPRILQIRAGSVPLAELLDANGDGRVDRVLLHGQR